MRQPAQMTRATRAVPAQGDSEDREEPLVALMMQVRASIVPAVCVRGRRPLDGVLSLHAAG